ncbi:TIGR03364 family FAD-dependent oxidoreductase [Lichenifustis flavocetrariae]|uniref:TIGR03364 family FAD-dependent oxidoreductase n=1 Tax=Lichenifustis flavocetrariae TaxID=2949735 RepID=A0AA41Z3H2_9HYPH|nr:TIGR03364 family FAD-dependent oxidoreductase [Lichenifustis flavocetrariae]MCW6512105.1 TIGR03364 family FAD-dependent oxidoreductase [Lichenifustis flavocetrariae]
MPHGSAFDLAIVGAGICGLAHALAAARKGKRVVVVDRDRQANGASIRNFGFITVTGQQAGACWQRAMRSRDIWIEVAAAAGIPIQQRGLLTIARRPEARAVLEEFLQSDMGAECRLVEPPDLPGFGAGLRWREFAGALYSPHEVRVESRDAIPQLAAYLAERHGVTFLRDTVVHSAAPPRLETSRGSVEAETVVVCPGDDFFTLHPERIAGYGLTRCKLHMMRLLPDSFDPALPAIMSDLGLVRYLGYAEQPAAKALRQRLEAEQGEHLHNGVHLIVVRSADGSLVVGDSHHYAPTPDPFNPTGVDDLILDEYARVFDGPPPSVGERWIGTYASAPDRLMLVDAPSDALRIVIITSGTGASTSFAIAEEVVADLFG